MDPFGTSSIIDGATALSQMRVSSESSVTMLRKALDLQGQQALGLIQSIATPQGSTAPSPSPPGTGEVIDYIA